MNFLLLGFSISLVFGENGEFGQLSAAERWNHDREAPMAAQERIDWSGCPLVEIKPGVQSGDPVLRGTRMPASAIVDNFRLWRKCLRDRGTV
jgi:hypothetical protein